jgi:hypothetical protein
MKSHFVSCPHCFHSWDIIDDIESFVILCPMCNQLCDIQTDDLNLEDEVEYYLTKHIKSD